LLSLSAAPAGRSGETGRILLDATHYVSSLSAPSAMDRFAFSAAPLSQPSGPGSVEVRVAIAGLISLVLISPGCGLPS